jgi:hypothetical protein
MLRHWAWALALLAIAGSAEGQEVLAFAHYQLEPGQQFEIQTQDRLYRGRLVNRATGETRMAVSRDGRSFEPERSVYLLGSTPGRQDGYLVVLMHEVKVGLELELGIDDLAEDHRLVTTPVTSIRLTPAGEPATSDSGA